MPALPPRTRYTGTLDVPDIISEHRLRNLLALIDPVERDDWRNAIVAVGGAKVFNENPEQLDSFDVLTICDDWA